MCDSTKHCETAKPNAALAIYDFRSKQEYIYRTNRMKEIAGASEIIERMYESFLTETDSGKRIRCDWEKDDASDIFDREGEIDLGDGEIGAVVYKGGGNLLVFYRDDASYTAANKDFSRLVIDKAYSLRLVCARVGWTKGLNLRDARLELEKELRKVKAKGDASVACNVLPYTFVDPVTFQPIVEPSTFPSAAGVRDSDEVSCESLLKLGAYERHLRKGNDENLIDNIGTKKGEDSLVAVLYFDGNGIGQIITEALIGISDVNEQIKELRTLSKRLRKAMVLDPKDAIIGEIQKLEPQYRGFRSIIDHGDEVTIICNAHAVPFVLDACHSAVETPPYTVCAGVAFCHSSAPFFEVYKIAKKCCEMGKCRNRTENSAYYLFHNYVDFQYVRAGITGSLDRTRALQEKNLVNRPYRWDEYQLFLDVGKLFVEPDSRIRRQDLKALNRSVVRGESWYRIEMARLAAKDSQTMKRVDDSIEDALANMSAGFGVDHLGDAAEVRKRLLFELTSFWDFFDLYFQPKASSASADEANANDADGGMAS